MNAPNFGNNNNDMIPRNYTLVSALNQFIYSFKESNKEFTQIIFPQDNPIDSL